MSILALAALLFLSLLLIPLGLPGTWIMVVLAVGYDYLLPHSGITGLVIGGTVAIAIVAEVLEFTVAAKYTKAYGGSKRGAWGAIIGGLVGAMVGVPLPIVGSVIGAIAGAFLGALAGELTGGAHHDTAARAATGAAIGRAVAMGLKAAAGVVIAAWVLGAVVL
jgi:uncharacterized protein YqgC (DUF456 family)